MGLAKRVHHIKTIHEIGFPGWPVLNLDWVTGYWGVESIKEGGLHQPPLFFCPNGSNFPRVRWDHRPSPNHSKLKTKKMSGRWGCRPLWRGGWRVDVPEVRFVSLSLRRGWPFHCARQQKNDAQD